MFYSLGFETYFCSKNQLNLGKPMSSISFATSLTTRQSKLERLSAESIFGIMSLSHTHTHTLTQAQTHTHETFLMEQHALKDVNNCLNINIYSFLETSGGQSCNLYFNVVHFFKTSVNKHLWKFKTAVFLHRCLKCAVPLNFWFSVAA